MTSLADSLRNILANVSDREDAFRKIWKALPDDDNRAIKLDFDTGLADAIIDSKTPFTVDYYEYDQINKQTRNRYNGLLTELYWNPPLLARLSLFTDRADTSCFWHPFSCRQIRSAAKEKIFASIQQWDLKSYIDERSDPGFKGLRNEAVRLAMSWLQDREIVGGEGDAIHNVSKWNLCKGVIAAAMVEPRHQKRLAILKRLVRIELFVALMFPPDLLTDEDLRNIMYEAVKECPSDAEALLRMKAPSIDHRTFRILADAWKIRATENPNDAFSQFAAGLFMSSVWSDDKSHYVVAMNYFKKAIGLDPRNAMYHLGVSRHYHSGGDGDTALFHAMKAVELAPKNELCLEHLRSVGLFFSRDIQEALRIEKMTRDVVKSPAEREDDLGFIYVNFWLSEKDLERALVHAKIAVELEPLDHRYLRAVAEAYESLGKIEMAAKTRRLLAELTGDKIGLSNALQ